MEVELIILDFGMILVILPYRQKGAPGRTDKGPNAKTLFVAHGRTGDALPGGRYAF